MSLRTVRLQLTISLILAAIAAVVLPALPAGAAPWAGRKSFASPRFEQVWRTTDLAVRQGGSNRSWTWGPGPWFDYKEIYKQSPNGLRQVQYFDKARMEINDPANTAGPLNGVTNGLLVVELVSRRLKLGNGIGPDENRQAWTADIPVAGDPPMNNGANPRTPTYDSFHGLATIDNGYRDPNKVGQRVGTTLSHTGINQPPTIGARPDLANHDGTEIVAYENVTGHNIPRVFRDFMNAGPVPAIATFGYPITDAYWITARVAGQDKDVLVQLFERRTVTYTPSNPPAFRVEMGNVGQHYFSVRYGSLGEPWSASDPSREIMFARKQNGAWTPQSIDAAGNPGGGTRLPTGARPYSFLPTWGGIFVVYGETGCPNGKRQLIIGQPLKEAFPTGCNANAYDPAASPDGSLLAYVSDRDGNPELYLQGSQWATDLTGYKTIRLTETSGCSIAHPSWLPDGSGLVYESNCGSGNWEIWRANLSFTVTGGAQATVANLISPRSQGSQLVSNHAADDRWPRVSPDGTKIAFFSNRDGNTEVYTMNLDGSSQTRLTNSPSADEAPAWSPDGSKLVFNSNRDGDHELFLVNRDGGGLTQLTRNTVDDGFAVWAP